jgi:CheY-like chemotaxis protein
MNPLVLLVDDSPDMGVIVRMLGQRGGLDVAHRTSVGAAWSFLRERVPDLVLLDMRLAGESGADLCRLIRASEGLAGLRVALFTNWVLHEDICAGLDAGADFVCAKDLVGQEARWHRRLAEILGWRVGRVWENVVACTVDGPRPSPPPDWFTKVNRALQLALGRRLSVGLLRVVLRKAVLQTLARQGRHGGPDDWLDADGVGLNPNQFAAAGPETAALLGASLVEQLWRLLSADDCAFFAEALAPVLLARPNVLFL